LGLFLRTFLLGLNVGQFPALSALYGSLVAFVDGDAFSSLSCSATAAGDEPHGSQAPPDPRWSGGQHLAPRQLQLWAHGRAVRLEQEVGMVSFEAVEAEVAALLSLVPDLPRAFWLRCLNCAMHKHQTGAFESLHKYFDFALRHG
jgi:hypothetical protein